MKSAHCWWPFCTFASAQEIPPSSASLAVQGQVEGERAIFPSSQGKNWQLFHCKNSGDDAARFVPLDLASWKLLYLFPSRGGEDRDGVKILRRSIAKCQNTGLQCHLKILFIVRCLPTFLFSETIGIDWTCCISRSSDRSYGVGMT